MKLVSLYTPSHRELKDHWFLPSLRDEYEISLHEADVTGSGTYLDTGWSRAVELKSQAIIQAIQANLGESFVYSDVDLEFLGPTKHLILQALSGNDIVCQLDNPSGALCTGFFAIRANKRTLRLWESVHQAVLTEHRDQPAFNRIIHTVQGLRFKALPVQFFGTGTFKRRRWHAGERIYVPFSPCMYHANWCVGIQHKKALLSHIKTMASRGRRGILANNLLYLLTSGGAHTRDVARSHRVARRSRPVTQDAFARPSKVCLDASTICQLKCKTCPTAKGLTGNALGSGFLSLDKFKSFVTAHPWITEIELSNWGEVFLNPELPGILAHARQQNIIIDILNGANLNTATDEVLEAVVLHRLRHLKCSIDGASQETYSQYRVNGNFEQVIANIRKINAFKTLHQSKLPRLTWQFVPFGHNEHDIDRARSLARELDMNFEVKLSWEDLYGESFSPVKNRDMIRSASPLRVADRGEYEARHGRSYIEASCHQLWLRPRINFDGRLLGCSINHWGDYGNVFEKGLEACLTGGTMTAARAILMGQFPTRTDIPCIHCSIYNNRIAHQRFVQREALIDVN